MIERYWALMTNKRFALVYLGKHHHLNVEIEKWLNIILAVISTGSLGALFIFENYQGLWSTILVLAQIVTAARPYLPFQYRMNELDKGIYHLEKIYNEIERNWYSVTSGKMSDDEINELYYDLIQNWNEIDGEILKKDSLPRNEKYIKIAQEENEQYFQMMFGGYTNE